MSDVRQYQGRQVDLLVMHGASLDREVELTQTLSPSQGAAVTAGIQKFAQRWLLEFLTERGSLRYDPVRGSRFLRQLRRGPRTTLLVEQAFLSAAAEVRRNLLREEDDTMPNDERFGRATLLGLTVGADHLSIRVQLVSRAGDAREVLLPLRTTMF